MFGDFVEYLRKLVNYVYARLATYFQGVSPGTVQLTGIVGLAVFVFLYYQVRGDNDANNAERRRRAQADQPPARQPAEATPSTSQMPGRNPISSSGNTAAHPASEGRPAPSATKPMIGALANVNRITICAPGVLLHERDPAQLQEAASAIAEAIACLKEIAQAVDTYVLAQVSDDVGQAVVIGSLEAAGLLGSGLGQIKPHRLLFCSTLEGKNSIVRQIEPELHVDSHPSTVDDLKRFIPQLVLVSPSGGPTVAAPNVAKTTSLVAFIKK